MPQRRQRRFRRSRAVVPVQTYSPTYLQRAADAWKFGTVVGGRIRHVLTRASDVKTKKELQQAASAYKARRSFKPVAKKSTSTVARPSSGQYQQLAYVKKTQGRKVSANSLALRAVKSQINWCILGMRKYGLFGAAPSSANRLFLTHYVDAPQLRRYFPLYCYDVTAMSRPASAQEHAPLIRLAMVTNTSSGANDGQITWQGQNGYTNTGLNSVYVQQMDQSVPGTWSPNESLLHWAHFKASVTGATQRPSSVTFQLVRFYDTDIDPYVNSGGNLRHQQFWQTEALRLVQSPIAQPVSGNSIKGYKVLGSKTLSFEPTSTTESDNRGHMKILNWFVRMNKKLNYEGNTAIISDDAFVADPTKNINETEGQNGISVGTGTTRANVSQRVVLIIKAKVGDILSGTDETGGMNVFPSFEYNFRQKHLSLANV
nr:capsid protein [Cressdnaviricota sp.]